jgi:membrane protein
MHHPYRAWRFARAVLHRFVQDDGFRLCGSLAFTSLLCVVPVITVAFSVFSVFPGFNDLTVAVNRFLVESLLPERITRSVIEYLNEFARNAAALTTVGLLLIGFTAFVLIGTIEQAFNKIWHVRRVRPLGARVLMYWGVMTLGPILVGASLSMTSLLVQHSLGLAGDHASVADALLTLVPIVLMTIAFTLLYVVVPSRPVALCHALVGGVAAAVMFELAKRGFALYVGRFGSYTLVYGTFAAVPVFLVWVYVSWVVTTLGAEIAALAPDYSRILHYSARGHEQTLGDWLRVLRSLVVGHTDGHPVSIRRIADDASLTLERAEVLLEQLADRGWVGRTRSNRWTLACDPTKVTAAQIYRSVASLDRTAGGRETTQIERVVADVWRAIDVPLAAIAAEVAAESQDPAAPTALEATARIRAINSPN